MVLVNVHQSMQPMLCKLTSLANMHNSQKFANRQAWNCSTAVKEGAALCCTSSERAHSSALEEQLYLQVWDAWNLWVLWKVEVLLCLKNSLCMTKKQISAGDVSFDIRNVLSR